ncbi:hypothetical protein D9M71_542840 [compost metagenome]
MHVLFGLQHQEGRAEQHGQRQPGLERAALVVAQGMVGEGQGETGADQQHGVDQRQVPGVDDPLRRRVGLRVGVGEQRPAELEVRPQHGADALVADTVQPGADEHPQIEQRAKEGGEEHHLGEDEPAHAPAERAVHLPAVQAAAALVDDVAEPAEQHVGQQQGADEEDQRADRVGARGLEVVEPGAEAEHRDQQADAGDDRPLALFRDVVLLMNLVLLVARHACSPRPCRRRGLLAALGASCAPWSCPDGSRQLAACCASGGCRSLMSNNV